MRRARLIFACLLGSTLGAQQAARPDPYTQGDPDALERAGYVSLGPFPWGPEHDTRDIEELLGNVPLRWVETAHFRLGSTLPATSVPYRDPRAKRKVAGELARLKQKLPDVDARTRQLDPWLRVHLYAQRLEELYADFSRRLGVEPNDFYNWRNEGLGKGPHLGMPEKFTVLLTAKESSMARYLVKYTGRDVRHAVRHNYSKHGSLFFGTAAEWAQQTLRDDHKMHCAVVYNVVYNLLDGFRFYGHATPSWFGAGLSQWYLRRLDPRHSNYSQGDGQVADTRDDGWDWEPRVRGLVVHGNVTPMATLLASDDFATWKFADYMAAWSRVDFLMSLGDDKFAVFAHAWAEPFHNRAQLPSAEERLGRQLDALQEAWKLNPVTLDEQWSAWVQKRYRKRPLKRPPTGDIFLSR